jgi:preprotein translocase subunit YajC
MIFEPAFQLLADVAPATGPNPQGEMVKFVGSMAIMLGALYFIMIRPQQKKAKEHDNLLKGLRRGDKIVFAGGIVGEVTSVKEKHVNVRSGESKFEVLKSAVTEVTERGAEAAAA